MKPLKSTDIGKKIGVTNWIELSQADIDTFGTVTRDVDPFHMSPAWAELNSPFGATIAYGFQTLSMLTYFLHEVLDWPTGLEEKPDGMGLNYGFERVRFVEPVPVGCPIRCHVELVGLEQRNPGEELRTFKCEVEIKGTDKPALIAEWKGLFVFKEGQARISRDLSKA